MSRLADVFSFGGPNERPSRWRRLMGMGFGLIYLLYPADGVLNGEVSGPEAWWQGAALLSFVASYVATALSPPDFETRGRWTVPLLVLTTLMAVIYPLLFRGGWLALPIFLSVVYAMGLPPRAALAGLAGLIAVVLVEGRLIDADGPSITLLVMQIITLGILFMSVRNTRVLVVKLRQAQGEVARLAATEERLRIARDLHDLLGHSLSLIVLKSELARRLEEQGSPKAGQEVADIEAVARQALVQVREAVTGYRSRSLAEELDGARSALAAAGVALTVRTSGTPLPDDLDGLFGWAVREAVTNVVRHARAARCTIEVSYGEAGAVLEVADDGSPGPYRPGNGLAGLGERVAAAGGTVEANPGKRGFLLRVAVPAAPAPSAPEPIADRLGG